MPQEPNKHAFWQGKKRPPLSQTTKDKIALALKNKKHTPEHCQNISLAKQGKPQTPEHRQNLSKALKNKPKQKWTLERKRFAMYQNNLRHYNKLLKLQEKRDYLKKKYPNWSIFNVRLPLPPVNPRTI